MESRDPARSARRAEALLAPPLPRTRGPAEADLTARAMRERGAPLLSISDNYNDDLEARFALDPALLAAMRECGVLYDRDQNGESPRNQPSARRRRSYGSEG